MKNTISNVTGHGDTKHRQRERRIREIETYGMKARGRKELLVHLTGKPLQRGQAIPAKCYDCTGYYADGKVDCHMPMCPLYGYMPYRGEVDH